MRLRVANKKWVKFVNLLILDQRPDHNWTVEADMEAVYTSDNWPGLWLCQSPSLVRPSVDVKGIPTFKHFDDALSNIQIKINK